MTRAFRAELIKIARFRMLWITAVVAVAFAVGSAAAGILNAEPAAVGGPAPEDLARAGGGTLSFTVAASFAGAFLLAVFAGAVGVEFSRGTLRTLLMQQPGRLRLVAGKLAALLLFAAVTVAVTQAVSVVAAVLFAAAKDISTAEWFTAAGWRAMAGDYGSALLAVTGWALLGTALGVLVPSVPVAVGIGVGWAGPVEQVLGEAWGPAAEWFPGLLLESLLDPEPGGPGTARALVTLAGYCLAAACAAGIALTRRDVTS
ncbi:ABC transporter permease [Micromonospora echinofusca]|uniref:ABC-2 family transporter protein n=1 Tax=Micromonospora echinofusca TaxID=47858 RepID=A0A1C5GDY1_MICEH|nr:ABC transporter permease [Micromonospora echinofusca]SCG17938.1 ABC-2 family transporter protein [Micromonospora echinofusca]